MRVLLVEQYFYPEGWGGAEIPRDIATELSEKGFEVDVLCGKDLYSPMDDIHAPQDPRELGIRILRVPRIFPGPTHRLKLARILWFCLYSLPRLLLHRGVDLYVVQTNPLLIVPTVALVARLRRKPLIVIAQDLYPEALFASGNLAPNSILGTSLRRIFSWGYRSATRVVSLGPFMQARLEAKGVPIERIRTISNWATGDITPLLPGRNPLRDDWQLGDRLVVLYSGNMGVGHEFETLLRGVRQALADEVKIVLVFIGGGVRLPEIHASVAALGLSDAVVFKSFVAASMLPIALGIADIAVVTLRQGFAGVIVPSKLLGYMARAIPTLYVGPDSDVAQTIREAKCGAACQPGDAAAVAATLRQLAQNPAEAHVCGENGRRYYARHFAREHALRQYVELVQQALGCATR